MVIYRLFMQDGEYDMASFALLAESQRLPASAELQARKELAQRLVGDWLGGVANDDKQVVRALEQWAASIKVYTRRLQNGTA